MAFIAIGFCISRRRNATKSSKCLLKSGLGHTKMRCPIQRKEAFKCLYCHKEFEVLKFHFGYSDQRFNKRNSNINHIILLLICDNLILHENDHKILIILNKFRSCWTLCYFVKLRWKGRHAQMVDREACHLVTCCHA